MPDDKPNVTACGARLYVSERLGGGFSYCTKPKGHHSGHSCVTTAYIGPDARDPALNGGLDAELERAVATKRDEFTMLCPTCGGLPVDHHEMDKLRAALAEALDGWAELDGASGLSDAARIAELRKLVKP